VLRAAELTVAPDAAQQMLLVNTAGLRALYVACIVTMKIEPKTISFSLASRFLPMRQLREITDALLLSDDQGVLDDAVLKLHSLLSATSGMNNDSSDCSYTSNVLLPNGDAISPKDAARCVIDSVRTSRFLRGICAALLEAQRRFPNGPIEILYAGCGPFAALAIPLTTRFNADQIQFTLLDVHARSIECAQQTFEAFGLRDYVRNYIQGDAASYVHARPLHMVITETMQKALSKEPQVAITLNLARQLCPGGIFIPERVTIDAYLCDPHKEFMPASRDRDEPSPVTPRNGGARIRLGRVFELTVEKATGLAGMSVESGCHVEPYLPASAVNLPDEIADGLRLMLSTTIAVFEMITLGEYESGLTHPFWLHDFSGAKGDRIEFRYCFNGDPGFKWQICV